MNNFEEDFEVVDLRPLDDAELTDVVGGATVYGLAVTTA